MHNQLEVVGHKVQVKNLELLDSDQALSFLDGLKRTLPIASKELDKSLRHGKIEVELINNLYSKAPHITALAKIKYSRDALYNIVGGRKTKPNIKIQLSVGGNHQAAELAGTATWIQMLGNVLENLHGESMNRVRTKKAAGISKKITFQTTEQVAKEMGSSRHDISPEKDAYEAACQNMRQGLNTAMDVQDGLFRFITHKKEQAMEPVTE